MELKGLLLTYVSSKTLSTRGGRGGGCGLKGRSDIGRCRSIDDGLFRCTF